MKKQYEKFKGLIPVSEFKQLIGCETLQFKKGRGLQFCSTPAGVVFMSSKFDISKPAFITQATSALESNGKSLEGSLWLVNGKEFRESQTTITDKKNHNGCNIKTIEGNVETISYQQYSEKSGKDIKNIYVGLPNELVEKILWVKRESRTNSLSHIPGGADIVIEYFNGTVLGYDWIKSPSSYISFVFSREILNYNELSDIDKNNELRLNVKRIFSREYENDEQYLTVSFEEVWNSSTSETLPFKDSNIVTDEDILNLNGCIPKAEFLNIIEKDSLEFKRGKGREFCSTPAGVLFKSPKFDENKESYVGKAVSGSKFQNGTNLEGTLWLVNKPIEKFVKEKTVSVKEYWNKSGDEFYEFLDKNQ